MLLSVKPEMLHYLAAVGLKCSAKIANVDAGNLAQPAICNPRRKRAEETFMGALLAPAVGDVVALVEFFKKQRDFSRVAAQVSVHSDDDFAGGVIESSGQSRSLPEISFQ